MKKNFQTIIIVMLCLGVLTTGLKPKKVEAFALSTALASVTAVALVGVLGYNLVMPKDKQVDVTGQLTGLFNKAKEWADGLPDWLYYSKEDFDSDLGSPTGVGTLSKANLTGVSSMIKDYLGTRGSFYLQDDNLIDTSSVNTSNYVDLYLMAQGVNVTQEWTYSRCFISGKSSNGSSCNYTYNRTTSKSFDPSKISDSTPLILNSQTSLPDDWVSVTNQYIIQDFPTDKRVESFEVNWFLAESFPEIIGKKAFAGYEYDTQGRITYKYETIKASDMVMFDKFRTPFDEETLGTYTLMGNPIRYFNHSGVGNRPSQYVIDVGVNAYLTVSSLQAKILNDTMSNSVQFQKTMTINDTQFHKNIDSLPYNQNGAIAIPQVPQFETDKEIGGFPLIDDINKILDGAGSGTGSGDLPIDNTDTLPKDTSFPTYPDILPFPDLSLHNVLSTDFFAQLFAWLGSLLTSPFVWLGSVINWAVTKLVLLFQTLIKALFMPTTTIDNFINLINAKFPIIGQVSDLVNSLINGLNINSERPRFAIQYYGTHDIIDFSIVDPFIGVIKALISFLLSFRFVKWLVGYIPKLLGGV